MIYIYRAFIIVGLFLLLVGCGIDPKVDSSMNHDIEFTKLDTTSHSSDQQASNHAKEVLSQREELTAINAVSSSKDIIIAIEVYHLKRFQLKKIKNKIQKEMDKEFPNLDVMVSTDKKIVLELNRLEQKIYTDSISTKDINKKLKELITLAKEQT